MIATLIIVLLILALGTRASDALEVRQQEIVLAKLSIPVAHDYYQRLRRRAWRARVLRGVAVLALITLAYAARRLLLVTRSAEGGAPHAELRITRAAGPAGGG